MQLSKYFVMSVEPRGWTAIRLPSEMLRISHKAGRYKLYGPVSSGLEPDIDTEDELWQAVNNLLPKAIPELLASSGILEKALGQRAQLSWEGKSHQLVAAENEFGTKVTNILQKLVANLGLKPLNKPQKVTRVRNAGLVSPWTTRQKVQGSGEPFVVKVTAMPDYLDEHVMDIRVSFSSGFLTPDLRDERNMLREALARAVAHESIELQDIYQGNYLLCERG